MKKSIILLGAVIAMLTACQSKGLSYQVSATLPNDSYDGAKVYLAELESGLPVDSTIVSQNQFTFSGKVDKPVLYQIVLGRAAMAFVAENGMIEMDLDYGVGKGTPANDTILSFMQGLYLIESEVKTEAEWHERNMQFSRPLLQRNADNMAGTFALWFLLRNTQPGLEDYNILISEASEYSRNFGPIAQMAERYEAIHKTVAGSMYTDFTIPRGNLDGSDAKLSDYVGKGKYILVDFWASWCAPCRAEIPVIAEVYEKYHGKKFDVLGVAVWDERQASIKAAKELGIVWNQIVDAQSIPTDLYGIGGIPHIILFGPDGRIIERELRGERLKEVVASCLE